MNTIDPTKAAHVWQRVRAEASPSLEENGLGELIVREWESASAYLQLSRRMTGRSATLLRKLFEQEQAHVACLKGIYTLITGKRPSFTGVKPGQDDPQKALRRCYGEQMQRLACYEQRSADPQYGHVFARLAQQEREHCHILLEILGTL